MYISLQRRAHAGITLVEVMVALAIFSIVSTAMLGMIVYCAKSFAALSNYSQLSRLNREAVDLLSRDIRQAQQLTAFSSNSVTILDGYGATVTYAFNPLNNTLTQTRNGINKVLLSDCTMLSFNVCQRNPIGGSYDIYPVATTIATAKVINLSWKSSRVSLNGQVSSENVQTARIVIRK